MTPPTITRGSAIRIINKYLDFLTVFVSGRLTLSGVEIKMSIMFGNSFTILLDYLL